jgi:hypothetical protein
MENWARLRRLREIFRQPMKFLASGWHYWKKTFFFKFAASSAGETPSSDWYPQPFLQPALIIDSTIEQKNMFLSALPRWANR